MRMKAQAALEFLMTYGWAILIVIAVVAALYGMGVFRLPSGGIAPCSPCFPSASDLAYVKHNATHVILKVGSNPVKVGGETYQPGQTFIYPTPGCDYTTSTSCDVTIEYSVVVGGQEMPIASNITLHKTW
jgi:hypothetical protein